MTTRQDIRNCLHPTPDGTGLRIIAHPRAARTGILDVVGDRLKIGVKAPPEQGKANRELMKFLVRRLGIPAARLRIAAGEHGRRKEISIIGLTPEEAVERLSNETGHP